VESWATLPTAASLRAQKPGELAFERPPCNRFWLVTKTTAPSLSCSLIAGDFSKATGNGRLRRAGRRESSKSRQHTFSCREMGFLSRQGDRKSPWFCRGFGMASVAEWVSFCDMDVFWSAACGWKDPMQRREGATRSRGMRSLSCLHVSFCGIQCWVLRGGARSAGSLALLVHDVFNDGRFQKGNEGPSRPKENGELRTREYSTVGNELVPTFLSARCLRLSDILKDR
jgi:hypothetical protein